MKKGTRLSDYDILKKRAIALRSKGMTQSAIGDVLGVRQSTVSNWLIQYKKRGESYLEPARLGGHKSGFLKQEEQEELAKLLTTKTAEDYGFEGGFWTYKRIAALIVQEFGVSYKTRSIGDLLKRMNFSWQIPKKKSYHQKEEEVKIWKEARLPALKTKANEENRTIIYIDESAFSYCPYVCRTYSPKGVRPVLKHGYLRGGVQAISAVTEHGGLYYQVKSGTFKGQDVADFLIHLLYHFRRKNLLIIWDGATQHISEEVKEVLRKRGQKRIHLERLPSYSPELNVDEQVHGYIKKNLLANRLFYKINELKNAVIQGYQYLKQKAQLVASFFYQEDTGFYQT